MAATHEKLAQSLEVLRGLQQAGRVALRSDALGRTHRERLLAAGFIEPVLRGWYIARPLTAAPGETTPWFTSYWGFLAGYLDDRFGDDWCLSPEQSIALHAGNRSVPSQLVVRAPGASNNLTELPHGTAVVDVAAALPSPDARELLDGLRVYRLPHALIAAGPSVFRQVAVDVQVSLGGLTSAGDLLRPLLAEGKTTVAGRLAASLREVGRPDLADDIVEAMAAAGHTLSESSPFTGAVAVRERSPWARRVKVLWHRLRDPVEARFPVFSAPDPEAYLAAVEDAFVSDAYNSLSIEGYRVSAALIERVRRGEWDPEGRQEDADQRDALAARGYWEAFQQVKVAVAQVLAGAPPADTLRDGLSRWYRALFGPSVQAGIIPPEALAGYRSGPVYIRGSRHVPPRAEAVVDGLDALFDCVAQEPSAAVRGVLTHFFIGHIHPFPDGNGRVARFAMNVMFASGGVPWAVVPVVRRSDYLAALEAASVDGDVRPFADLLADALEP